MMKASAILVLVATAAAVGVCNASPVSRVFGCPDVTDFAPCVCYTDSLLGIFLECINLNSMAELKDAFSRTMFPFKRITRLEITDSNLAGESLGPIFKDLTFREVLLIDNHIDSVDANVFMESVDDLSTFQYTDNATTNFPLSTTNFANLRDLIIEADCDTIPTIDAPKLLNLVLTCSKISGSYSVDGIVSTELQSLQLDRMPGLTSIAGDLTKKVLLRSLVFERNGLNAGHFSFSENIVTLDLSFNKFEDMPEIEGVSEDAKISMRSNDKLRNLLEGQTKPLIDHLAKGVGTVDFTGVAVFCNCDFVWLTRSGALGAQIMNLNHCMSDDGNTQYELDQGIIDFLDMLCPKP
ncbi:oplophorus-luciferin 2-monooxygenase non-catalytic subunit-like [Oratosquilla oratoria]|uniref:oplophorus-luciferin 2-monooxygenase non-catalytic subunit-like n=1 Tax=Oratosquilla oratoria TaxID=337810 RepID=UPI003F76A03E